MSGSTLKSPNGPNEPDQPNPVVIGSSFVGFLDRVAPVPSRDSLRADATAILQDCGVSTSAWSSRTGLIVGRVQSGKTLSYEGVIALARDNGFAMVVVISGISNPLLDQGVRRLKRDLTEADPNGWNFLINPSVDLQAESSLRSIRENWTDPDTPVQLKKTAVCLLLKHHGRIDAFVELCERIGWSGQKVLIIDDEADQASLNVSFRRGRESATYRNIRALRSMFDHHAYLQYTATPQAPLLIAISDALSPDFVRVLEPGSAYVGGLDYFGAVNRVVQVIPDSDLVLATDPNGPPPLTLASALREFVLGATHVLSSGKLETRSMLVHPSRLTAPHVTFVRWIRSIIDFWRAAIEDVEQAAELRVQFLESWTSLKLTDPAISEFSSCWDNLRFVLRNLQIIEMNTREHPGTPVIDWDSSKTYVLVGGQALDRGFTVEGLSVTYMPRDPGTWTADTIQQRARFFGYKRSYFGQCRVYLEPALRDAFEMYVEHERDMIRSLRDIQRGESSLNEWKRHFLLDPAMKPTRRSVISLPTIAVSAGERWIYDPRSPGDGETSAASMAEVRRVLDRTETFEDDNKHVHALIPMKDLIDLIEATEAADTSLPQMQALKLQIAKLIDEEPASQARLIYIRPTTDSARTLTSGGFIQPFQGASGNYPGDRAIIDPIRLTVQVHEYAVRRRRDEQAFARHATLAFWLPDELSSGWLVEDE